MKYLFVVVLGALLSCQPIGSSTSSSDTAAQGADDTSFFEPEKQADISQSPAPVDIDSVLDYVSDQTFLLGSYRIWEKQDDPAVSLRGEWLQFYRDGGVYKVDDAEVMMKEGYDDCAGVKTKIIESDRNASFLLRIPGVTKKEVPAITVPRTHIWPGEHVPFEWAGESYTLQATGKINATQVVTNDAGKEEVFHDVSDYRLELVLPGGSRYLLAREDGFNDTFVRIDFVGDLDGDNKPDFVLNAPRDYEEERVLVILSSTVTKGKVRLYEACRQFDC
ncbi:hypothetical protein [Sphingobacterium suaedae]|uniref:VCBS repeat-containing protein n=1 Tax=Sphingobacterium suaedae TaxID=1686402 RepID=A0ABW5KDU7_9SPHI